MDFKTVVDISSVIGAMAVIFGVLRFFYTKSKIASEKQDIKNAKLKGYIETLLSKATSDAKRNEIYPYVSLLANNHSQFSIEMRLKYNLLYFTSFCVVVPSSLYLFTKLDGIPSYTENSTLFLINISMLLCNLGIIFTVFMHSQILKRLKHMQVAINDTYIESLGNQINDKYLENKT